jgi:predicted Fe-Mo cluster-binding NifX family protein
MVLAIPTNGETGLEDFVSDVFGKSSTFTVMKIEDKQIKDVKILENPAKSYEHGAGPIAVKMLVDHGVNMIIAGKLGIGASSLLEQHNIKKVSTNTGIRVKEAILKVGVKI